MYVLKLDECHKVSGSNVGFYTHAAGNIYITLYSSDVFVFKKNENVIEIHGYDYVLINNEKFETPALTDLLILGDMYIKSIRSGFWAYDYIIKG